MSDWISVDVPPTPDRNILLCIEGGYLSTGYLCLARDVYIVDAYEHIASDVTHWMPLPEPPEEGIE